MPGMFLPFSDIFGGLEEEISQNWTPLISIEH